MEIQKFLDLSVGNWFCQRTSYLLNPETAENSKSELQITSLDLEHPEVVKLCEEHNINPQQAHGGIKSAWDNSVDWGKPKAQGFSILIVIADSEQTQQGKILQTTNLRQEPSFSGSYIIGNDEAITLSVVTPEMTFKERIWFPSENLRLRTSVIESQEGWIKTSFYSEIRKLSAAKA